MNYKKPTEPTSPLRILLVTQYFYPENFKSNDIAFELSKRGYKLTVLTGIPNYPAGSFFKGYGVFQKRRERIHGVKVIRALLFPRGKGGGIRIALNYLSWAIFASFHACFHACFHTYDAVIVHAPSPITQGIPALIIKKLRKTPLYLWVLDLWPESLVAAGGITNKTILGIFTKLVKLLYSHSSKILIASQGFKHSILDKGDYANKLIYFPNWAEDVFSHTHTSLPIPNLPLGFLVMFAGNIGEAQDLESMMQCAMLLKARKDIKFIFVGNGRKKPWLDAYITQNGLHETVYALGQHPLEIMPALFQKADLLLLALKDAPIFSLTIPSKLQAYMASGRPIVAMLNGNGAQLIADSGCGKAVAAGDYSELAEVILSMTSKSVHERKEIGAKGRAYFLHNFRIDICIDKLCSILQE
jgi:Glycosyltransferase